uniref:Uncharacterized protein n=1 Tax=Cyprinus carpio TaxID=7962 RepID=A0A8C1N8Z3_CYPCA
ILSFVSTQRRKHTATQARGRTRVNIGAAFQRWRELKELTSFLNPGREFL